ncbi:MAG: DUF3846 domain-containing protein [Polyangiaceae bacterium]|jgi:hypothetical protein
MRTNKTGRAAPKKSRTHQQPGLTKAGTSPARTRQSRPLTSAPRPHLIKRPSQAAKIVNVANTLEEIRHLLDGGYVQILNTAEAILYVDEEGRLKNLPYNLTVVLEGGFWVDLFGPVVFLPSTGKSAATLARKLGLTVEAR